MISKNNTQSQPPRGRVIKCQYPTPQHPGKSNAANQKQSSIRQQRRERPAYNSTFLHQLTHLYLVHTKIEIEKTLDFLKNTRLCTRKWHLERSQEAEQEVEEGQEEEEEEELEDEQA
jgi:hypothetical protein